MRGGCHHNKPSKNMRGKGGFALLRALIKIVIMNCEAKVQWINPYLWENTKQLENSCGVSKPLDQPNSVQKGWFFKVVEPSRRPRLSTYKVGFFLHWNLKLDDCLFAEFASRVHLFIKTLYLTPIAYPLFNPSHLVSNGAFVSGDPA